MKKLIIILLLGTGLAVQVAYCQNPPDAPSPLQPQSLPAQPPLNRQLQLPGGGGAEGAAWQKFNLDFPGGSPRDLVSAIEKATGKPLNALISTEDETVELPPM